MTKILYSDKSTGSQVDHLNMNEIKSSVNTLYDINAVKADLVQNLVPLAQIPPIPTEKLPEAQMDDWFVDKNADGIVDSINEDKLRNFVLALINSGGTPKLGTPTLSFGTSTATSNIVNWTSVTSATGYVLEKLINTTWQTIYTGNLLTYTDTGLTASTSYQYRVHATATNFTDSDLATGSKSTSSSSGENLSPVTSWSGITGIIPTGNNIVSGINTNNGETAFDFGSVVTGLKILTGAVGYIRFSANGGNSDGQGITFGLDASPINTGDGNFEVRLRVQADNTVFGGLKDTYHTSAALPVSDNSFAQIRLTGTLMITETSSNGGTTWTTLDSSPQPQIDLFAMAYTDHIGRTLNNVNQFGFVPV